MVIVFIPQIEKPRNRPFHDKKVYPQLVDESFVHPEVQMVGYSWLTQYSGGTTKTLRHYKWNLEEDIT